MTTPTYSAEEFAIAAKIHAEGLGEVAPDIIWQALRIAANVMDGPDLTPQTTTAVPVTGFMELAACRVIPADAACAVAAAIRTALTQQDISP